MLPGATHIHGTPTISEFPKFRLPTDPNQQYIDCRPVPTEGRAHVTNVGRDAVDAAAQLTNSADADGEVVWF